MDNGTADNGSADNGTVIAARSRGGKLREALLRPAVLFGVGLGALGFVDLGRFESSGARTWALPLLPLSYLLFGAVRGRLRSPRAWGTQAAGLLGFTALASVGLFADPRLGQYVVGAGWAGHAVWDLVHRDGTVVPRWYADLCFPTDLLIAAALVAAALL
jgi:hypothetical protein